MRTKATVCVLAFIALFALAGQAAHAQATRTWVSGVGDDANPCSRTAPCKTFAGAISKTAPAGEINVLDPGGFGAVTITKAISIRNDGVGSAGVLVSGTNGIVVSVPNPTDTVILKGLDIEGLGTSISGVLVSQGGNVTVQDSTINNFKTGGITWTPTVAGSKLHVLNTIVRNCGTPPTTGGAITLGPSAAGSADLNNVGIDDNVTGLKITTASADVAVTNSTASNNTFAGFANAAVGSTLNLSNSLSVHNATGVVCTGETRLANMTVTDNTNAISGTNCFTFKNNNLDQIVTMTSINPQ